MNTLTGILTGFTLFWVGFGTCIITEQGRIQVASGQYECHLTENPDKTTYWVCEK